MQPAKHIYISIRLKIFITILITLCSPFLLSLAAEDESRTNLVDTILQKYNAIHTVQCDVRREMITPKGSIRWLSRVYFDTAGKLHAANASPISRLIIADGETMFQHTAGQTRGFKQAITNLNETMLFNLQRIPGTAMEHLKRLENISETTLEPKKSAAKRSRYETGHIIAILEADAQNRIQSIRFYDTKKPEMQTAEVTYSQYEEVLEGIWIPMIHQTVVQAGESEIRERIRFTNYVANTPLPAGIFDATKHFEDDVEWVDSFDQL
jgi:hypothetical protein